MKYSVIILAFLYFACVEKKEQDDNPILGKETITFIIQDLPDQYDFESDIYISGNFEGWSGGREQFKLKKTDSILSITLPKYRENISFKFTQGKWGTEECQLNGYPIENRTYNFKKVDDTVYVKIANWANDKNQDSPSTASENVRVFSEEFEMPQLHRARRISIYLPPDYVTSTEHYPVLYMHDGQNVFDAATSYSGEWKVDETLNRLHDEEGFGLIVVAIDHGGDKRLNEYAPYDHQKYGRGEGDVYLDFVANTLKPAIDRKYRTNPDKKNTAIMGSSMGGLISHYAVLKHPNTFGKAGIFSPSFWMAEPIFDLTKTFSSSPDLKLYYLAGGNEGKELVANVKRMSAILDGNEFLQANYTLKIVTNGIHSESFWKEEFEDAIKWLFEIENKS